ncbi:MAG TPA: nitroreductase family protein [Tepidisphaeraceae bacterium]|nr:nitroreductase family protein [Tepidisphaeraceae bacterium]
MDTAFAALVKKARSYRRFNESDPIPPQMVRELVDWVRLVSSAANQQPLRYRIVTDVGEREQLFRHLKWAAALKDWGGPVEGQRPTAYIVICAPVGKSPATDVGIAAQTIQLAATDLGYGACMLGASDRPGIHAAFALPKDLEVQLVVALGWPGETIVLEDHVPGDTRVYWRTPDQVHHVPKRTLDEVLL